MRKQLKLSALSVVVLASASVSAVSPAYAANWGDLLLEVGRGLGRNLINNRENIRSRTGNLTDQIFVRYMSEDDVQKLKTRYGGDWQGQVDQWCNDAVISAGYGGTTGITVPGVNSTWRAHGNNGGGNGINCYARVRNF